MSEGDPVRLERRGAVAWLVLNRPQARNSLTVEMRGLARELLAAADADQEVTVIAVTGAGDHFCGGGDIPSMPDVRDVWEGRSRTTTAQGVVAAVRELEKPTIAVARGTVAGLGVSLFGACDLRLAADGASFQAGFPGVGLIPDGGLLHLLPRLIGWGRASDWMLLNQPIDAATAHSWGLASFVVEDERLEDFATEIAGRLGALPRNAVALTKAGLRMSASASWEAVLEFERTAQGALIADPEARERVRRFLDRKAGS
jgi:2-(1,2-epoxy-1,2-dihydrophenyl)acetyl-CoA isomerase